MRLLGDIIRHNSQVLGSKAAVIQESTRLSYGELNQRANRLVHGLRKLGVQKGDRVAFLSRNDYRFVELYFGLPKIGAIFIPLNFWATGNDLAMILNQSRAKVLIVAPEFVDAIEAILPGLPTVEHVIRLGESASNGMIPYEHLVSDYPNHEPDEELDPDEDILILYTSGSTGKPKGAVYTHRSLIYAAMVMAVELGLRETDTTLHFLPVFSSNLEHLLPTTLAGATHVIMQKFDAAAVWETVARERVTHFDAVPTIMRLLLQCPGLTQFDLGSMRLVTYASEPMPASTITKWLKTLPHVQAVQFYGMIEFLCMTVQKSHEHMSHMGTVGKPMLGTDLRIVDDDGRDVPPDTVGEVVGRSLCAMHGYWEQPDLTRKAIRDGWMYSGDLGKVDKDGFLTLVGRKKNIILSAGMTIAPAEIEEVLYRHHAVAEVAVIGRPDTQWGEAVHAVVALRAGEEVTAEELVRFCADHLAGYKKPRSVAFLPSLPKTGIGKIDRSELERRCQAMGQEPKEEKPS